MSLDAEARYWKDWARKRRADQGPMVQVVDAPTQPDLKAEALSDPAKFAAWPLRLQVPAHHASWYALTQMYLKDLKYRKLLIIAPTGFGKTTALSLALPIFEIVKDRSIPMGLISANLELAKQKLRAIVHQLTGNQDLITAFGEFRPKGRQARWTTTDVVVEGAVEDAQKHGRLLDNPTIAALGWESNMEGRHWDLAFCDDVADYIESQSPLRRSQLLDWYLNVFLKRMNPEGREVWIGTRAHQADIYQYLMDSGKYTIVDEPQALVRNENGEEISSWEEQWPTATLLAERESDSVSFSLKRMNEIVGTGLTDFTYEAVEKCKDTTLSVYGNLQNLPRHLKERNLVVYAGVDLAVGISAESKFFGVIVEGVDPRTGERFLLDLKRHRLRPADQRQVVHEIYAAWMPREILVENNGTQAYFFEDSFHGMPVTPLVTGSNKVNLDEGLPALVSLVKHQRVHIPWADVPAQTVFGPMVKELHGYPKGETNDLVMAWWFCERKARMLFLAPAKVSHNLNLFRRRQQIIQRFAGGYHRGRSIQSPYR